MKMDSEKSACPFHSVREDLEEKGRNFDMFGEDYQKDPPESLKQFREERPIFFSEKMNYWIVTRYEDIKTIFRDPVLFSARNVLEKFTPNSKEADDILKSYNYNMHKTLVNEDEPIHMERRRELLDAFSNENLAGLRTMVQELVTEQVDSFIEKGKIDLVPTILWEVPLVTALKFLGVPEDDIAELQKFGVAHKVNTWGRPTGEEQIKVATAVGKFWHYSGKVLERMKQNPEGKGWMYDTIRKNRENPEVVTDSYLHSMMMAILVAAHETTSTASANAIIQLLSSPNNLWKKLHDNPELIPGAVEECLRYKGPIVAWRREATEDTEVSGVKIAKGDKLFLVMAAANRDPEHFENPEGLDIFRDNASEHLSFGYGAHQCLGKNIGRIEICAIIEELTRRIPELTLPDQEFTSMPNTSFHGPESLIVEWDPAKVIQNTNRVTFPIGNPDKKKIFRSTQVKQITDIAEGLKEITLKTQDKDFGLPPWTPGSHVAFLLPNGLNRKYSLCPSTNNNEYTVVVKREEESEGGSEWIHDYLKEGDSLPIQGPKNFFKLDSEANHYLLIAGGIGITPILSMADHLKEKNASYQVVYCGRKRKELAYIDRLDLHADNLSIFISSEGERANLDLILSHQPKDAQIYACGPERMIDALTNLAEKYELSLKSEPFNSVSSMLDPENETPFEVELINTGKVYAIPKDKTILDVLLENDIDVAYDCSEGICGSCEVIVESGEVEHRDKVLTKKEKEESKRMMSCCSRGKGRLVIKL